MAWKKIGILLFLALISCSRPLWQEPGEAVPCFELNRGLENFKIAWQNLENPRGILPALPDFEGFSGELIRENPEGFYSFFIFDRKTALFLLSVQPLYYLKISGESLIFHLEQEFSQLKSGLRGVLKTAQTHDFYRVTGENRIALYFTPKELYSLSTGSNQFRMASAGELSPDLWRNFEAAKRAWLSFPVWEDLRLEQDLFQDSDRRVRIFTGSSPLIPARFETVSRPLPFGVIRIQGLTETPFFDQWSHETHWTLEDLKEDAIFFFSLPLGNPAAGNPVLSQKDGFVVEIRGNIASLESFLNQEGLFFISSAPDFFLSEQDGDVVIQSREIEGAVFFCRVLNDVASQCRMPEDFQETGQTLSEGGALILNSEFLGGRGYLYRIRVGDVIREILLPDLPKNSGELIFTEIMWAGSTSNEGVSTTSDDWFEIKNVSGRFLSLSGLKFRRDAAYWNISADWVLKPGDYAVFAATKTKSFTQLVVGTLFFDSEISLPGTGGYCLAVENSSSVLLDEVCSVPAVGAYQNSLFSRSRVLKTGGIWESSGTPFSGGGFDQKTFGTPGKAGENEE